MFGVSRRDTLGASLVQPNRTMTLRASRLRIIAQLHHLKHRHFHPDQPTRAGQWIRLKPTRLTFVDSISHFLVPSDNGVTA